MTQEVLTTAWDDHVPEVAHLLNPAFLGEVLVHATISYQSVGSAGLPFALAFLIPAIVLPADTRRALPRRADTRMVSWLTSHPEVRVSFANRVRTLAPFTRAGLTLSGAHGLLQFNDDGTISPRDPLQRVPNRTQTDETRECFKRAQLVGEWFATAGPPTSIFDAWGIRP